MSPTQKLCQNDQCQVETDGKCFLGKDPVEQCPNYAREDVIVEEPQDAVEPAKEKSTPVEICSGDVMHLEELAAFARTKPVRTVALVGEQKAGKTTLLASIYALFCRGAFGGMAFAGSRTLVGFAKRHHLALLNSGLSEPATPRTSRDEPVAFFHLALAKDGAAPVHLVISDRSGEAYGDARVDTDLIHNLPELQQADRVCFLLDGAKLASKEQRPAYSRQFKQMIHALYDNGALANVRAVEVLATKFDLTKRGDAAEQVKFLDDYERTLIAEFEKKSLHVECYRVCALPKSDKNVGFLGLDKAIERWTAAPPRPDLAPEPIADAPRQIDRLLARVDGGAA